MDHRAGVIAYSGSTSTHSPQTVQAEQAIFTSIRTPMGEGYRLVAMSPGITGEERAEITRRSPSHGSLCDPDPAAQALSSYPLASTRQCVAWTRYAGREHTARGGQRVHTHLAVLEPAGFAAFDYDPFRVHAAMREAIGDMPNIKPNTCMPNLALCPRGRSVSVSDPHAAELPSACQVAVQLLTREAMLVVGGTNPFELLRWTVAILPQAFRVGLAASANLQYAASRQMRLTCAGKNSPELQRAVQGQPIFVLDLACAGQPDNPSYQAWFDFVLERFQADRLAESLAVADQLEGALDAHALARIAAVCRDAAQVEQASQAVLEELANRYCGVQPAHPAEVRLVRHLLSAAVRRSAILQHAACSDAAVKSSACRM